MVWVLEKKVFHHFLDLGFEMVTIPVRVKFEFEVEEGVLIPNSISIQTLYNKENLEKRYPNLKLQSLDCAVDKTVQEKIHGYLKKCGYLNELDHEDPSRI